tara:strand:- start:2503 stop:2817 length:315 start_codon:yes stop_codon:yes gene_type:complete
MEGRAALLVPPFEPQELFVVDVCGTGVGDEVDAHDDFSSDVDVASFDGEDFDGRWCAGHHASSDPWFVALGDGAHVEQHFDDVVSAKAVAPVKEVTRGHTQVLL